MNIDELYGYIDLNFIFKGKNTKSVRHELQHIATIFLNREKSYGTITDYKVTVDETNNTYDILDNNLINLSIMVSKPNKVNYYVYERTFTTDKRYLRAKKLERILK